MNGIRKTCGTDCSNTRAGEGKIGVLMLHYSLINVLYVIMMEYTISYREVCYLVNRVPIHFSVLYRLNSWSYLMQLIINMLMFSSTK